MYAQAHPCPEDRLFDALGAIFQLETEEALGLSKLAVVQIANYVADLGAVPGSSKAVDAALLRLDEMQLEISDLSNHLHQFRDQTLESDFH